MQLGSILQGFPAHVTFGLAYENVNLAAEGWSYSTPIFRVVFKGMQSQIRVGHFENRGIDVIEV